MTVTIELSPAGERRLRARATRQGANEQTVAADMLEQALASAEEDFADAIGGIQRGLDDFEAGRFRPFADFVKEQRAKYNLHAE